MGNDIYDENKRLKKDIETLRERLQEQRDRDALPNMMEGVLFAFFQNRAQFVVTQTGPIGGLTSWAIRFQADDDEVLAQRAELIAALTEIEKWLANGDYDTRGGLIEMDRLASIARAAIAKVEGR